MYGLTGLGSTHLKKKEERLIDVDFIVNYV